MTNLNKVLWGILIAVLLYNITSFVYEQGWFAKKYEYDFKNTKWGMSIKEVKASEDAELVQDRTNNKLYDSIIYENVDDNFRITATYEFTDNKLVEAQDLYTLKNADLDKYIKYFNGIKEELTKIYGEPMHNLEYGSKDPGKIFLIGSIWETHTTTIKLSLSDLIGNMDPELSLEYESKKYKSLKEKRWNMVKP